MEKEDLNLAAIGILTGEELERLAEYEIRTLGQLLGATRGLTRPMGILPGEGAEDRLRDEITRRFPDLVARYAADREETPATGWLGPRDGTERGGDLGEPRDGAHEVPRGDPEDGPGAGPEDPGEAR